MMNDELKSSEQDKCFSFRVHRSAFIVSVCVDIFAHTQLELALLDTDLSAAFESTFPFEPSDEETAVSLIKIIVITIVLLLSVLFFWRFLF